MPDLLAIADSMPFRTALAVVVLSSFAIYKKLNERSGPGEVLMTRLDRALPLIPVFSVPYLLYIPYLMIIVSYGILLTPYYARIAASTIAVQIVAAVVYRLHATTVPRPEVAGTDPFSRLTRFIYRKDRPHCAYPSLHVAYAVLCGYWTIMMFPGMLPAVVAFTAAIILSTVFLKQHALIDVVGGASLAMLAIMIV